MPDQATLVDSFKRLEDESKAELIQRDDEIYVICLGLVAGVNVYLLSEPGTAKTLMFRRMMERIDGCRPFSILLSRHTPLDDVIGPLSIPALTQGQYLRLVDGFLPTAHTALLDEFPRTSQATAEALMELINEGTYNQSGQKVRADLHIAVAAANTTLLTAENGDLAACWDRFVLRKEMRPVSDVDGLRAIWDVDFSTPATPVIDWADVAAAHRMALTEVKVPDDVFDVAVEIKRAWARDAGAEITNRRWAQSKRVIQAAAFLDGHDVASVAHLEPLAYLGWSHPDQIPAVERIVGEAASPGLKDALAVSDTVAELIDDIQKVLTGPEADREAQAPRLLSNIKRTGKDAMARSGAARGRSQRVLNESLTRLQGLYDTAASQLMGTPDPIPFDVFLTLR